METSGKKGSHDNHKYIYGGSVLLCNSGCTHHFFAQLLVLVEVAMASWDNGVHLRRIHLLQSTPGQGRPTDQTRLGHRVSCEAFTVGGHGMRLDVVISRETSSPGVGQG